MHMNLHAYQYVYIAGSPYQNIAPHPRPELQLAAAPSIVIRNVLALGGHSACSQS